MDINERDTIMREFRYGQTRILITTNVLSRGIDVLSVNLVINYDIPTKDGNRLDIETYLHRVGRTARGGNSGVAISIAADFESKWKLDQIQKETQTEIKQITLEHIEKLGEILNE